MRLKICFFAILATLSISVCAQYSAVPFKSNEYLQFKASKTYAVKTGDKDFDDAMAAALTESWKITPFDFIDDKELKEKIRDKNASFIMLITISVQDGNGYNYLSLVNGGKRKLSLYNYADMIAYAPINHFGNEPNNTDCAPRLRNMLEAMVNAMNIVEQNDIRGNTKKIVDRLLDYYRTQSYKIKDRVLLISKDALGKKLDENDVTSGYPYKFEFCSQQKINDAIKNKDKNYYYYQPAMTQNKDMFVFDPVTGEVVYGDFQIGGKNIKKSNIEDLVNVIKRK